MRFESRGVGDHGGHACVGGGNALLLASPRLLLPLPRLFGFPCSARRLLLRELRLPVRRLPGVSLRLRRTYGDTFDVCNSDIRSPYVAGLPKGDVSINDGINTADVPPLSPDELQSFDPEARWVAGRGTGGYRAGDIVIFHKYCVHGSTVNVSADSVRLSTDVRFQPSSDPVDYRHTATPGREVSLCTQSAAQMRQLRELFDERKKGPPRPPAHRSMGEALREWGIAQPTRSRAAAL